MENTHRVPGLVCMPDHQHNRKATIKNKQTAAIVSDHEMTVTFCLEVRSLFAYFPSTHRQEDLPASKRLVSLSDSAARIGSKTLESRHSVWHFNLALFRQQRSLYLQKKMRTPPNDDPVARPKERNYHLNVFLNVKNTVVSISLFCCQFAFSPLLFCIMIRCFFRYNFCSSTHCLRMEKWFSKFFIF